MIGLLFIIPWGLAAGLTYWFMETNGSKLKKDNPTLYNGLKDSSKTLKEEIEESEKNLEKEKKDLESSDDGDNQEEAKKKIKTIEEEVSFYKSIEQQGLWMPVLSFSNIGWTFGILVVSGLIFHYITKKIIEIFISKKSSN